ncbi:GspH/FimT family pseudopilin [Microbulbifer sp. ALW1]|uniref:GspH/FimT family pseudopilin n=1 Tax=Microbulbifer sp. (strain ALW1) TaxID=1516059 RepID=UPI00135C9851|nr:GspH/FimT family pseudopilin [Microbulbifer sp. ALW1]
MRPNYGTTLLELIIGLAILSVIASIAVPAMGDLLDRYRTHMKARELFNLLVLMRSQAYNKQKKFTLCPSDDDASCGNNWSSGAILFADLDGDGERDSGEPLEKIFSGAESGGSLNWNAFNNTGYIIFRPNGTTPAQSGNFSYCPPSGDARDGWIIILNTIGRPYLGKDKDGDGIKETGSGRNLSCQA